MLGVILLTLGALFAVKRKVVQPLQAVTGVLQKVAAGHLDHKFKQNKNDLHEVRVIWGGLESLTSTLQKNRDNAEREKEDEKRAKDGIVGALMTGLEKMAEGNLTHDIQDAYGQTYTPLVRNYNTSIETLRTLVSGVMQNAAAISHQAVDLRRAIDDLSQRTEVQAESVSQAVNKLGELSMNIKDMAESAVQSEVFVGQATETAQASSGIVGSTVDAMELIKASSEEISKFTSVIDEIAFQTGLLSLNAGVEAARAGESGRGFAIVAIEVRNLAKRATESATEIKSVIDQSLKQVEIGELTVTKTGESFQQITDVVQSIREGIEKINNASQEQTAGVHEIGSTMDQLNNTTRQNTKMVEEVTATSAILEKNAKALRIAVDRFVVSGDVPERYVA